MIGRPAPVILAIAALANRFIASTSVRSAECAKKAVIVKQKTHMSFNVDNHRAYNGKLRLLSNNSARPGVRSSGRVRGILWLRCIGEQASSCTAKIEGAAIIDARCGSRLSLALAKRHIAEVDAK